MVLIDHQPFQFANLHSHEPTMIVNNVIGLAKTAKVFDVPTILTTVLEERGGFLIRRASGRLPRAEGIRGQSKHSAVFGVRVTISGAIPPQ